MKKILYIFSVLISAMAFSQVGINQPSPHTSADLELGSDNKALLLNRVANTAAIPNPTNGMVIYDMSSKCVKIYQGEPLAWSDCINSSGSGSTGTGTVTAFTCGSATFNPATATQGQAYNGHLEIPYTGGNGGTYTAQSFTSNGLTFTLAAGNFETGDGLVRYNITGTPTNSGTTYVEISLGGKSCGGANAMALSVNGSTPTNPQGPSSGATGGRFTGKACFDVAQINEGGQCGSLASRQAQKADFTQTSTNTQSYTFTPTGTVSNVRFSFVNTNGTVITSLTGGNSGNNITGDVTATVHFNTNLNSLAAGKNPNEALTADIYVTYNASADNTGTDFQFRITVNVKDCICCGAFVAPGVWKQFMCHNLGATTTLDPHVPVAGIHGNKYVWSRSVAIMAQTTDQASSGVQSGWPTSNYETTNGIASWSDDFKTGTDPCPVGFRVPTRNQFQGVINNNLRTYTGTFANSNTNYGSAIHYSTSSDSPTLTLPAVGRRIGASPYNGTASNRGESGFYWTSSLQNPEETVLNSRYAYSYQMGGSYHQTSYSTYNYGYAVRCIAE